jgi:DNA modification methylase
MPTNALASPHGGPARVPAHWPADSVERRPVAALIANARNARTHSEAQIGQIAASIREWGWTVPVLIDEAGLIIAGHGRVLAAQQIGLVEVPVMVARGWSEAQKRAYLIADNKLTENGGWDDALLRIELTDLAAMGFDAMLTGFDAREIKAMGNPGRTDPDDLPEPPDPDAAISRQRDVWICGDHRIVCGDATDPATVALALDGATPLLMVTDPPYGVDYDPDWRNRVHRKDGTLVGGLAVGKVENDDKSDWRAAWALFPGDVAYVWNAGLFSPSVFESLLAVGFDIRAQIIWAKSNFAIGRGDYHWQHECCWYAVRKGKRGRYNGDRTQSTLWDIAKSQRLETGHSAQKPVECMKRPIENNSLAGELVYDPFVGSGTTMIAAETTGRLCRAIELYPPYVDVAVLRWQNFTGQIATLQATGEAFPQPPQAFPETVELKESA